MSLDSALLVASGGLANINRQMAVVSNNIANADTPDYAREVSTQTALTAGGQGLGVFSGPVIREINVQLQRETYHQNATVSGLQTRQTALAPIDAAQGTPGSGTDLGSMLGKLQDAFTSLQSDPSSSASQGQVVSTASLLANQINTLSRAYGSARQNAQGNISTDLASLNAAVKTVAGLTDKIVLAQQSGQSTADLENQRDTSLHAMSALTDMSFIQQPDGGLVAATTGGLAISLRTPAPQFSMAQSTATQQTFYPGGGIQGVMLDGADVTQQLTGGSIGANIELRDKTLLGYQAQLDEFANTLQSRLSGQGIQLFTSPSPSTTAIVPPPVQSGYVGYAATIAVNPAVQAKPSAVRDGNLTVAGSATGPSAFTPNPASGPASFEGLIDRVLSFGFGTQAQAGVVQAPPNVSGLGPGGGLSAPFAAPSDLASFATSVVSAQSADVGNVTSELATETSVQAALKVQTSTSSGVSTDSELSKMISLQNAYGANARIISATQSMWTELLNAIP